MAYAANIAIDIFGMVILLLMLVNFGAKPSRKPELNDFFFSGMLVVNLLLLFSDMFTWVLNGLPGEGARTLNILSNTLHFLMEPCMCLLWVLYCEYKLHESIAKIKKRLPAYAVPAIACIAAVMYNSTEPIIFSIGPDNLYTRGPLFFAFMGICFGSFVFTTILTLYSICTVRNPHPQHTDQRLYLLLYPLFPLLAALMQATFYGIAVIWMSTVISLLIIYFNFQNAQITMDPLTGLNNRRRFESFMQHRLNNRPAGSILFLLMIDIDKFKSINDQYGHATGDDAIREAATLLMHSVRRSDFIARIGGDEFVVVGERASRDEVGETVESIQRAYNISAANSRRPYKLSFSIGYSMLHEGMTKTMDEMMAEADQRMYSEKQYHSIQQPRKSDRSTFGGISGGAQSPFD